MYDVIVIGAGPAGASAAFNLAESGLKVLVMEKDKLPRYKTCGGGIIKRAADLLPFSINSVIERELVRADIFDHDNDLHFIEKRSENIIFMVMRSDFDSFLLSKAVEKGAFVNDDSEVIEIENLSDCVSVKSNKESHKAKFVIAADGAKGISGKNSRRKSKTLKVAAIEAEVTTNQDIFNKYNTTARFDYGLVPYGYAWIFPKRKHLSIGVAFMKNTSQSLHKWLDKYFEILNIQQSDILKKDKHGYFIPLFSNEKKSYSYRTLYVGDALGLADPITAEGISYAIESGQLAAKAITKCDFEVNATQQNYKQNLTPVFTELNSAKILSNFVFGPDWIRKFVFKHYGKRLSELMTDIITSKKTYIELVHDPVSYIKLLRPRYFVKRKL